MAPSGEASIFSREVQRFKVLKPVVKEGWTVKSSMNKQEKINAKFATLVTTTEVIIVCLSYYTEVTQKILPTETYKSAAVSFSWLEQLTVDIICAISPYVC